MPNRDGTGPLGRGAGGQNRPGRRKNLGGSSECECPKCGHKISHSRGVPCSGVKCPKCETPMKGAFCK